MNDYIKISDGFFPKSESLRQVFDQKFATPLDGSSERFVWDYWHVPDQYTLMRTPAYNFFPEDLFTEFENHLISWGQRMLGCADISPAWLSYYVDGCKQDIHADNPHGPWAFVYSLTNWADRNFTGGETFILKPEILDYWQGLSTELGLEKNHIMERVAPEFNRLTVFDPRRPHGVEAVHGTRDPRNSRIVIHGWFTEPRPFIEGGLADIDIAEILNQTLDPMIDQFTELGQYDGILTIQISVDKDGSINDVKPLASNIMPIDRASEPTVKLLEILLKGWGPCRFPETDQSSTITLPLVFH